ncbi:hypothetical protein HanPSC8_Chr06g0261211 [Helianthus annuus]|nr:hypothetical protein HanPSC8_Chr06g0261211 [Helianthus annuus]
MAELNPGDTRPISESTCFSSAPREGKFLSKDVFILPESKDPPLTWLLLLTRVNSLAPFLGHDSPRFMVTPERDRLKPSFSNLLGKMLPKESE